MYSKKITQTSTTSNYSSNNLRDIVLDTAENLTQIGQWTRDCFHKEQNRIELFFSLTRKNVKALQTFPLSPEFDRDFKKFCASFEKLEEEYRSGIVDRTLWANVILKLGHALSNSSQLI